MPDVFRTIMKPIHNFDQINEESAYWIGYLLADGCMAVKKNNIYTLMLECKTSDVEILQKFCKFLNIREDRITDGHQGQSKALSIADSNFTTSVQKYGIIPNKSYKEHHIPQEILQKDIYFLQFLKGIIDGDGTIHNHYHSPGVSFITNSQILAMEVKTQLELLLPEPSSIWIIIKDKKFIPKATQNLYTLKIGTGLYHRSNMNYLYQQFYKNQPIILTRKQKALKELTQDI